MWVRRRSTAVSTAIHPRKSFGYILSCASPCSLATIYLPHTKAAMFPETMCKAGWDKEDPIDALYRKAGYRAKRPPHTEKGAPSSTSGSSAAPPDSRGGGTVDPDHDSDYVHDPVVSRTAVFLRFETVSFRMDFCKYQRAKAAAHESTSNSKLNF